MMATTPHTTELIGSDRFELQ
ncbi:MAG TPA: NADH-quinone oxidoreductase subunit E, partial [Marinobacter adhaerens]|nr:NADH-quinone oxidoreductase subunit E [Marinobacter adhaerens]